MAGLEREAGEGRAEAAEARGEVQDRGAAAARAALKEGAS
jgi:hypothetical protein